MTVRLISRAGLAILVGITCGCGGSSPTTTTAVPVATVSISGSTSPLQPGQSVQLTASPLDAGGATLIGRAISWTSSNSAVATVSAGLVTAVAPGTTTITASSEGKSASVTFTVNAAGPAPVASIAISGGSGPLVPPQTLSLTATVRDAAGNVLTGRNIAWSSSAAGVATVSGAGVVTAVAPGTTTIMASSEGKSATLALTVNAIPVATVVVVAPSTAFAIGDAGVTFSTTIKDGQGNILAGRSVAWTVAPAGVVSVSSSGVVTPIAAGNATVTATSEGISGSVQVTVAASSAASLLEQRVLAQQGLAIALASTVLQTQIYTLIAVGGADPQNCLALTGGGAIRIPANASQLPAVVTFFFDTACTRPYMAETVTQFTQNGNNYHLAATAAYTGPTGTPLGSISFDESANNISFGNNLLSGTVNGLGTYISPAGGPAVTLGLNCNFSAAGHNVGVCQGGITQSFLALNVSLGSVATLALDSTSAGVLSFTGGSDLRSGGVGALGLLQPSPTSMQVIGGTAYGTAVAGGGAASFSLFPPTPTGWTVTDAANDMVFSIGLIDNATRTLGATLKRVSTGATLATLSLDQSGTGTIVYSDGLTAAVTSWMLRQ